MRHPRVVVSTVVALLVVVVGVAAWYLLAEQRRTGRLVAATLSRWTGLPISVDRATTDGSTFRLRGVRVAPTESFPLEIRVSELDIEGSLTSLIAPAGHTFTAVATAATVTVEEERGGRPVDSRALEMLRDRLRRVLDWSGGLTLRMPDAELVRGDSTYRFDLSATKQARGTLSMTFATGPASVPRALRVEATLTPAADGSVKALVGLTGDPGRLGSLWPAAVPRPASLTVRGDVGLRRGGDLTLSGRVTVGEASSASVVVLDARWDAASAEMAVSRYVLDSPSGLHLEGAAAAGASGVRASGAGTMDGSRIEARVAYQMASGAFDADVVVAPFDLDRLARRIGWNAPMAVRSHEVRGTLSGVDRGAGSVRGTNRSGTDRLVHELSVARVELTARSVMTPPFPDVTLDASLRGEAMVDRTGGAPSLVTLRSAEMTLGRSGVVFATLTGRSKSAALWPIHVEGGVPDATRLQSLLPAEATLKGSGTLSADLDERVLSGELTADLGDVRLTLGAPIALSGVRIRLPIALGVPDVRSLGGSAGLAVQGSARGTPAESPRRGETPGTPSSVFVEHATISSVAADRVLSSARLADDRLLLPDVLYVHYGGHGGGWIEAAVDGRAVPFRARFEGERVDLAALVRELGINVDVARVTGRLKYVASAEYRAGQGFVAVVRFQSEDDGGRVGIDAVNRLLQSSAVQTESSGLLRRTLESLRVFDYRSLEGELRVSGGASHLDLTLLGKRRLGLFPGPIDAITIKNAPLSAVARAFRGGTSR
jgi:hypothetical protein